MSSFRFDIAGLDATKVTRIEDFIVKLKLGDGSLGELRDFEKVPAQLEFGNLEVTLASSSAATWEASADDFILKGNNGDAKEKSAMLSMLSTDKKSVLAHVDFVNVGIFRLEDLPTSSSTDATRRTKAHLYCERADAHCAVAARVGRSASRGGTSSSPRSGPRGRDR